MAEIFAVSGIGIKGQGAWSSSMKILALNGSPRRRGNTDLLVDAALAEAAKHGHKGEKLYLYDYEIKPCVDCRACKKGELVCVLKDDMPKIYEAIDAADALVLATPIYWYGPTAKMKLLIDRLRPYVANRKLEGKKAYLIAPSEEGPSACGPLVDSLKMSYKYLGLVYGGEALITANEKGEVAKKPEEMEKARRLLKDL
ncbi:MAG: flavodoxin family protein [Candidatus Bathyarchaeota archaeon]|nr:flavodoxin family protein [Candidatus Bathyarchaeota archaeon]